MVLSGPDTQVRTTGPNELTEYKVVLSVSSRGRCSSLTLRYIYLVTLLLYLYYNKHFSEI